MNSNLIKRIITAVILIPVVVAGVLMLPNDGFAIALGVFVIGGAWEWSRLAEIKNIAVRFGFVLLVAGLLWVAYRFSLIPVLITGVVFWLAGLLQIVLNEKSISSVTNSSIIRSVMGLLVLV
ncbi:MAG: phosphatidate cytidylyltransferase, partial [Gammaproteobacteria bacterium]|nr:phosphatidate cytidylyltransferase [Gammaproteobacteria bacterium]